jgi:hypothetical protein
LIDLVVSRSAPGLEKKVQILPLLRVNHAESTRNQVLHMMLHHPEAIKRDSLPVTFFTEGGFPPLGLARTRKGNQLSLKALRPIQIKEHSLEFSFDFRALMLLSTPTPGAISGRRYPVSNGGLPGH